MTEKQLEKELVKRVKRLGGVALKLLPFLVKGLPDRLCLFPEGRVGFAEIKGPNGELKPLQKYWLKKLTKLGFKAVVIDSPQSLQTFIDGYSKKL